MTHPPHVLSRTDLIEYILAAAHTGRVETMQSAVLASGELAGRRGVEELTLLAAHVCAAVVSAARDGADEAGISAEEWFSIVEEVFASRHPSLHHEGAVQLLCAESLAPLDASRPTSVTKMVLQLALVEVLIDAQLEHIRIQFPQERIDFAEECAHWVSLAAHRMRALALQGALPRVWLDEVTTQRAE